MPINNAKLQIILESASKNHENRIKPHRTFGVNVFFSYLSTQIQNIRKE